MSNAIKTRIYWNSRTGHYSGGISDVTHLAL